MTTLVMVNGCSRGIGAAEARLQGTVPRRREGAAEEVARAIVWHASSCPTGSFVDVAGRR